MESAVKDHLARWRGIVDYRSFGRIFVRSRVHYVYSESMDSALVRQDGTA